MPNRGRIVVFGDVIDDVVVIPSGPIRKDTDTVSSIRSSPGGSAANAACWMASFGADVDFVGRVAAADIIRHEVCFDRSGVTAHLIGDEYLPTGTIVIIVDGDCRTMLTSPGSNTMLSADDIGDGLLEDAALLHFTGYSLFGRSDDSAIRRLIDRCARRGVQVSVDPASAGYLVDYGASRFFEAILGTSMIFPNLEEGRVLTGLTEPDDIVRELLGRFRMVALTLDTGGVLLATGSASGSADVRLIVSRVADRVDPTGAGDAFAAGFIANWVASRDDTEAAHAGVAAGALAVATIGGRPSTT